VYEPTVEEAARAHELEEEAKEHGKEIAKGKLAKQGETSMEWFVLGKEVLCKKCAGRVKGAKPLKLASLEGVELECAKCGAKPLDIKKGAIIGLEGEQKIYCPECAKKHEGTILAKANSVIALEEDDIVPTPLWCDECGKPIPVAVPEEVATVLRKTIDGLEAIVFEKGLKESRPALWRKALQWKEKLDDYLLAVQLPEPKPQADNLRKAIDELEEIIFDTELRKSRPDLWKRAVELKETLESEILEGRHPRNL
jgi:Zn finger protein HypA/HybF involved in hydrogenase expression